MGSSRYICVVPPSEHFNIEGQDWRPPLILVIDTACGSLIIQNPSIGLLPTGCGHGGHHVVIASVTTKEAEFTRQKITLRFTTYTHRAKPWSGVDMNRIVSSLHGT